MAMDEDEFKKKVDGFRSRYTKIVNDAKKANLETGAEKAEKMTALFVQVKKLGIPLGAFKDTMTTMDHHDKAMTKREDVVDAEDEERLNHYDRLLYVMQPEILPLFDAATRGEIKRNADAVARAGETKASDDGKVVPMKQAEASA